MDRINGSLRVHEQVSIRGRTGQWLILRLAHGIATLGELDEAPSSSRLLKGCQVAALVENLLRPTDHNELPLLEQKTA